MKTIVRNIFSTLIFSSIFAISVSAQPGSVTKTKYGKGQDSIDCIRHLSLYQQDYRFKNYDAAVVNWRKVFKDCPQSSVNLAAHGIAMYQDFIVKEVDPTKKAALVDTLMQIYEKGMVLRPQNKGTYLASMAQDMIRYSDGTPESQRKILKFLEESMALEKEETPAITYANYMKITIEQNDAKNLSDEELLENYTKVSDYLSAAIKKTPTEDLAKVRDMIDDSFANSKAANCNNLVKIYGAKFETNKNDLDFLRKLTRILSKERQDGTDCTDTQLFEKASEQQFALDPSSAAAYNMAKLFIKKDNFDKVIEYFESAIQHENDPIDKANYYYQLGNIRLAKFKQYTEAKKCALEASKLRPDWGLPYVLLANTYAAGPKCGEDEFEKAQIYWVIVDKLQKAKSLIGDDNQSKISVSQVNSMINQYSQHFPKKEEAFFRDITEGNTINVGCWINETTKARFN